ncbi:MAG: hypothetical protein EZS28_046827 [Streblomastix strix]|uniref:Uncharacterized protein n=1 Tax=Streblomastix strix TaxID=222440 RepID=A0A5J4THF9_9EUKA|nr:MAG: hypothetical protein EZS28_046827 [Streblomastix strix]
MSKKESHIIHVDIGEIIYVVGNSSKEEAIKIVTERTTDFVTETQGHCIPRIVKIDGEEYEAPPSKVSLRKIEDLLAEMGGKFLHEVKIDRNDFEITVDTQINFRFDQFDKYIEKEGGKQKCQTGKTH